MRAIFGAVTFPQQRSWAISLAAPNHALLVPSSLLSYQTHRQFAGLGPVSAYRGCKRTASVCDRLKSNVQCLQLAPYRTRAGPSCLVAE